MRKLPVGTHLLCLMWVTENTQNQNENRDQHLLCHLEGAAGSSAVEFRMLGSPQSLMPTFRLPWPLTISLFSSIARRVVYGF